MKKLLVLMVAVLLIFSQSYAEDSDPLSIKDLENQVKEKQ